MIKTIDEISQIRLLTCEEAAYYAGMSKTVFLKHVKAGEICKRSTRGGDKFLREEVEQFCRDLPYAQPSEEG